MTRRELILKYRYEAEGIASCKEWLNQLFVPTPQKNRVYTIRIEIDAMEDVADDDLY